jgi:putative transposase
MKSNIMKLTKWFCLKLTLNELTSIVPVLLEVLAGSREDIQLKPEEKPPHYRNFRVDTKPPLLPESRRQLDWQELLRKHEKERGRKILTQSRAKYLPSPGCRCQHCDAPAKYLAINNGKLRSQVRCKICEGRSPANRRVYDKSKFLCPSCRYALSKRQETEHFTSYRCTNIKCPHYLARKKELTGEEQKMCSAGNANVFKLHYHHREYHIDRAKLKAARPSEQSQVDLGRIHNSDHVLGLVLTFSIDLGLSSRVTRKALKGIFDIDISHQTVLNYINAAAGHLQRFVDENSPIPSAVAAADETYIIVENRWQYTWFIIDSGTRAICGYNLSGNRGTVPALALLHDTYGLPENNDRQFELTTDGNPSYDSAIMAYNQEAGKESVVKRTVIGLKNLDEESTQYRRFKQLVERLNRTYKYHTRPRAGFKSFDGAVALTTLFVAYYNFMRPHSSCNERAPVQLECLQDCALMPEAWIRVINSAAA